MTAPAIALDVGVERPLGSDPGRVGGEQLVGGCAAVSFPAVTSLALLALDMR